MGKLAFGLFQRRLVGTWVDFEEQITLFHIGAVLEVARDDLATDLCLHFDALDRGAGADLVQIEWNVACHHLGDYDQPGWWSGRGFVAIGTCPHGENDRQERNDTGSDINTLTSESSLQMRDLLPHCNVYVCQRRHISDLPGQ